MVAVSLKLVAFGLDSLVEVFASLVVLWHMAGVISDGRDRRAGLLVGLAFAVLAVYLFVAGTRALIVGAEPDESILGIFYLAVTAVVMFVLGLLKRPVL